MPIAAKGYLISGSLNKRPEVKTVESAYCKDAEHLPRSVLLLTRYKSVSCAP
jgi:hypothetical protein